MNEQQQFERETFVRMMEVRAAEWLSFPDLCLHCGFAETKMKELTLRPDFPRGRFVTESTKGKRWNKREVDEWMELQPICNS